MSVDVLPAKRLVFDRAQWAVLRLATADVPLPDGFDPASGPAVAVAEATAALVTSGVLLSGVDGPQVHPAVRVNLELFSAADFVVRTTATIRETLRLTGLYAARGQLGGSLLTNGAGVELSAWPAGAIAHELARAVPALPALSDQAPSREPIEVDYDLGTAILAVAAEDPEAAHVLATTEQVPPLATRQLLEMAADSRGSLQVLVLGQPPEAGTLPMGEVIWIGSDSGWTGLRLVSHLDAPPGLSWQHVEPEDLGSWVAPALMDALA